MHRWVSYLVFGYIWTWGIVSLPTAYRLRPVESTCLFFSHLCLFFFSWISIVNLTSWVRFVLHMLAVYSGSFEFSQNTLSYCSCDRMGHWRICVFVIIVHVICRTDCLLGYLLIFSCPTDWVCSLLTSHPFEGCNIHNVVISYIWTDKGSEFYNKQVQDFLKEKHVTHFFSRNEKKANVAERGIKTIKARLIRYMTHIQTHQRGEVLPKIIKSYNATYHRTNNRAPHQVKTSNGPYICWMLTTQFQKRKPQTKVNKDDSL